MSATSGSCALITLQLHAVLLVISALLVLTVLSSAPVDITRRPLVKLCALSAKLERTACQEPLKHAPKDTTVLEQG